MPIRILHLEDNPHDAEIIQNKLAAGGLACDIVRVDGQAQFGAALAREAFDVVLCDYNLPGYDGLSALKLVREQRPETPVMLISGSLGEDEAVQCLQQGAKDYLLKQRLDRLPAAVKRALQEAAELRQRRQVEQLLAWEKSALELIVSTASLSGVLDRLMRGLEQQAAGALCSILLLDADGIHLRHGAGPSLPDAYNRLIDGVAIGPNVGSCGTAAYTNRQVIVVDISSDPLWADYRELALVHGLRACWSTPIHCNQGKVLGTFAIYYREPRSPAPAELELIERAKNIVGIAIERRRGEEVLQMMHFSVDRAGDGVFWLSPDGHLLYVNDSACARLGYAREELLGMTIFDLDPDYQPGVWGPHWQILKRHRTLTFETRHRAKDGRVFPIEVNASYVHVGGREFNFAFVRDITERKAAEEAVRQRVLELERFHRLTVGRELRMIEMKKEVNELSQLAGRPPPYDLSFLEKVTKPEGQP